MTISLLSIGLSILPSLARAGFFASLLGEDASASTTSAKDSGQDKNSQTLELLEASSAQALSDPDTKTSEPKEGEIDTTKDVYISDNALVPATGPLGVSDGEEEVFDYSFEDLEVYVVRSGDTVPKIAEMFGISADTIYSANEMKKGEKLTVGDVLIILPFSAVEHTVAKGQTILGIAKLYGTDQYSIISANHLEGAKIVVGDKLIIPGGKLLEDKKPTTPGTKPSSNTQYFASAPTQIVRTDGYFIHPVPSGHFVRDMSSKHKGVDIGAPTGTPILATADGVVLIARNGWNGGFGNMVVMRHSNGTRTLYAHMSKINTVTGAQVSQGQVIGFIGSTGRSTGPHLHYEVHGGNNNLSRKR